MLRHGWGATADSLLDAGCEAGFALRDARGRVTAQVEANERPAHLDAESRDAYDETLAGWARALDLKDSDTAGHSHRVIRWTVELAHVRREAGRHVDPELVAAFERVVAPRVHGGDEAPGPARDG